MSDPPPLFVMQSLTIRCNPENMVLYAGDDEAPPCVIELREFDGQHDGAKSRIRYCYVKADSTVPLGRLVVSPGGLADVPERPKRRWWQRRTR